MKEVITTKRLELKPYQDSDQSAMIELLTNQRIKESFMIPDFKTDDEVIRMFKRLQAYSHSDEHFERGIYLQNQLIGFVNDVEMKEDMIELGYVIHPNYQNNGYATEMLKAVIEELLKAGFQQIVAGAFERNTASIQVMIKCGMKKIEKEEDISYRGILQHCCYYAFSQKMIR